MALHCNKSRFLFSLKSFCFEEHFGSGLSVMMKALTDLQAKGDLLVKEITKQKETLDDLQAKIRSSESNLTKVNTMIDSKESFLSRLQKKILQSQKDFAELGTTPTVSNDLIKMILVDSALKKKRMIHEAEYEKLNQRMEMLQNETEEEEIVFRNMIENKQEADGALRNLRCIA